MGERQEIAVRRATGEDRGQIGATLASAFARDPVMCWITGLDDTEARLRGFFSAVVKQGVRRPDHEIYFTEDGSSAAVWRGVGRWRSTTAELLRSAPAMVASLRGGVVRGLGLHTKMEKAHPREPHYYLEILGTRADRQGKGTGSAIIGHMLDRCDTEGMPAYLESSNPRNVPFYARHGFVETGVLDPTGSGPVFTCMWRDPALSRQTVFDVQRMSVRTRTTLASMIRGARDWLRSVAAIGPDDDRARVFAGFGEGSCITFPPGTMFGEAGIRVGRDTLIGPDVALTAGLGPGIPITDGDVISIGDRCNIGRGSHLVGLQSIVIGDDVTTGPNVYVTDHNHAYADTGVPVARQWLNHQPVRIGDGCWLGANAVVLPGSTLGRNVVVAANSVVRGEVPDFSVVAGVPAKVVRRHDGTGWDPPLPADGSPAPDGWWD